VPLEQIHAQIERPLLHHDLPMYRKISKFPPAIRDVTFVVESTVEPHQITSALVGTPLVLFVELVDRFESDKKLGAGKVALTFRFIFQDLERSLEDEEVTAAVESIFHNLSSTVKFEIR
jgi:phenylalanyl-tRNA synthetase beta chain